MVLRILVLLSDNLIRKLPLKVTLEFKDMFLKLITNSVFKTLEKRLYSTKVGYPGKKADVNGINIHYEIVGNGPQNLLLLPGAVGSSRSDFGPQLEKLNREKYTIVAWDPPGYGFSRPPDRYFDKDFYRQDGQLANQLMKVIERPQYSVIGWSDGGITGLIMAALYNDNVQKLVVFGASAFITDKDLQLVSATRDISKWSEKMRAPLVKLYGEEYFERMWCGFCDIYEEIRKTNDGNICREELKRIKCPVLIVHGDKDPMVDPIHPDYLNKGIKNSKLVRFPEGKHNLHLRYADEFNKLVELFLDE